MTSPETVQPVVSLASDVLAGAGQIAAFLFGADTPQNRRRVFYLVENSKLPTFRYGTGIRARRTVLLNWIEKQEQHSMRNASISEPANDNQQAPALLQSEAPAEAADPADKRS